MFFLKYPLQFVRELNNEEINFLKQSALNYVDFKNEFLKDLQ